MDLKSKIEIFGIIAGVIIGIAIPLILKDWRKLKRNDDNGLYYYETGPQNPYCPRCYEDKNKKVKIPKDTKICPKCKNVFSRTPVISIAKPTYER